MFCDKKCLIFYIFALNVTYLLTSITIPYNSKEFATCQVTNSRNLKITLVMYRLQATEYTKAAIVKNFLKCFGFIDTRLDCIHHRRTKPFFLQDLDCLYCCSCRRAHHILECAGMHICLEYHLRTA